MINPETLQKAVASHTNWKSRLRTAITRKKFNVPPAVLKADNQCEFGKWLYGPELSNAEKRTEFYGRVVQMHSLFHREAAKVVEWAIAGQEEAAERSLGIGGYATASADLTRAMNTWRESLSVVRRQHGSSRAQ